MKKLFILLVICLTVVACDGNSGSSGDGSAALIEKATQMVNVFNSETNEGMEVSIVKLPTLKGNWGVFMQKGSFWCFNLDLYNGETSVEVLFDNIKVNARDQVIMVSVIEDSANPGQYIPVTGSEFVGTAVDNNGNFIEATESMVSGWVFEETSAGSKDLEGAGAKMEKMETSSVKEMLSSYGFSVERTERLSSLLISYKKISSKRALNTFEKDMFTKELTGLTFEAASKELVNNYEGLIEKAAERNGIDPEAVKEVILQVL